MRSLTITRKKTFVGCAMSLKVYLSDESGTTMINGTACRLLGKLKNGETQTFEIDENARRVYVIADQLSKKYCNEFMNLPAGEEDIVLSGCPKFNPATGNAFRFDGVTDPEVLANRKQGGKSGLIVLLVAVIVGLLIGIIWGFGGI